MTNKQHIEGIVSALEKQFSADVIYDYFSAFHDVVVLGHTSGRDDNPHEPNELPSHELYQSGAVAAKRLVAELRRVNAGTACGPKEHWRN
ncbi:MAG: hypothetical protein ACXWJB_08130 [Limisphaerales bacterium]